MKKIFKLFTAIIAAALLTIMTIPESASATSFALSPMYQLITLTPGETYTGNFSIVNPATNTESFDYTLKIEPFYSDGNNNYSATTYEDYNLMVDWIKLAWDSGTVAPNSVEEVRFTINVPEDAAAGGQYASITVSSAPSDVNDTNMKIQEVFASAHLIYAEVAGETVREGEINDVNVPSFLFSGQITGSSRIKNTGNVHSKATSTLQVFPLFSNEEMYTNEENPKSTWVMPGNNNYSSISWEETPNVGIFHVIYDVEYEGVESKVDKIVIVCPLWLLFVIILALFLLIFRILSAKKKSRSEK